MILQIPRGIARVLLTLAMCIASNSCDDSTAILPDGSMRVLFIGNSLTYANDMPYILEAMADSTTASGLEVNVVAEGNYSLVEHYEGSAAHAAVSAGGWSYVVLQQGPSSLEVNRDTLRLYTGRFNVEIVREGARTALYSVWPARSRIQDFPRAIESYELAAEDVNGLLLPVAAAWLRAWELDPQLELYDPDGLHPSLEGSYLAALVMYLRFFPGTHPTLPARLQLHNGRIVEISAGTAATLLAAALDVVGS